MQKRDSRDFRCKEESEGILHLCAAKFRLVHQGQSEIKIGSSRVNLQYSNIDSLAFQNKIKICINSV